eukprot:6446068-Prymnesium_polylepis.1
MSLSPSISRSYVADDCPRAAHARGGGLSGRAHAVRVKNAEMGRAGRVPCRGREAVRVKNAEMGRAGRV